MANRDFLFFKYHQRTNGADWNVAHDGRDSPSQHLDEEL